MESLKSPEKQRYIVAPPLYQQSSGPTVQASLRSIHATLQENIVRSTYETGPKVLNLSPLEAALVQQRFPSLLVEPDVQYQLARSPLCPAIEPIQVAASGSKTVLIQVTGGGHPIPHAQVMVLADLSRNAGYEGLTDENGELEITVRSSDTSFPKIMVDPPAGFWSRIWRDVQVGSRLDLEVTPLTIGGFDWGLVDTEAVTRGQQYGEGVKVAIIDSGIGPHPSLHVAGGHCCILGQEPADWGDADGHGTHCAGVVAALDQAASIWGYAPKVELYALRVFGGPDGGGFASDIRDAIDWAIGQECDIISMSFASDTANGYIRGGIEKATDSGVLCIAAAGNQGGPVQYPAKFRNVVGVSAVGKVGTFPSDSIHSEAQGSIQSPDRQHFLASFSNHGDEIDVCAPGVAVTSTLPADGFAPWDGTSMACPHVAGIAALALEASQEIRTAPRDAERMGLLLDRVLGICTDLGMSALYQGSGLPKLSRLFTA